MKLRVYVDTSVIGGCCDPEFSDWSERLMEEIRKGRKIAVISDLTERELEEAPEEVREVLKGLPEDYVENVSFTEEAEQLSHRYLREKVVTEKHLADAQHIAIATVERVDVLASWNFQQIVNLKHIHAFNAVNLRVGYPVLEIRSPREVIDEKNI